MSLPIAGRTITRTVWLPAEDEAEAEKEALAHDNAPMKVRRDWQNCLVVQTGYCYEPTAPQIDFAAYVLCPNRLAGHAGAQTRG
jgi:hypothetical protein